MSVSYRCKIVAGVSVPKSSLQCLTRVRGCGHAETKSAFCSKCGQPMWVEEEGELALLFPTRDIQTFEPNTTDFETEDENLPVIIGLRVSVARSGLVEPVDLVAAMEKVQAAVKHVGLENTGPFGLHLVRTVG